MKGWNRRSPLGRSGLSGIVKLVLLGIIFLAFIVPSAVAWPFHISLPFFSDDDSKGDLDLPDDGDAGDLPDSSSPETNTEPAPRPMYSGTETSGLEILASASPDVVYADEESEIKIVLINHESEPVKDIKITGVGKTINAGDLDPLESKTYTTRVKVAESTSMKVAATGETDAKETFSDQKIVRIAVVHPALRVTVSRLPYTSDKNATTTWKYDIENTGDDLITRLRLVDDYGNVLGILPQLSPGENQPLIRQSEIIGDESSKITVVGIDSTGREVVGTVYFIKPRQAVSGGGSSFSEGETESSPPREEEEDVSEDIEFKCLDDCADVTGGGREAPETAPEDGPCKNSSPDDFATKKIDPTMSGGFDLKTLMKDSRRTSLEASSKSPIFEGISKTSKPPEETPSLAVIPKRLDLTIQTNKTRVYDGEVISYSCRAENVGSDIFSDVEIRCRNKKSSVKFLGPGDTLQLDGLLEIHDDLALTAEVEGTDTRRIVWTNSTSVQIHKISPELTLDASMHPEKVYSGGMVSLSATVENSGDDLISDITVYDSFGEIGKIPLLNPSETMTLEREMILNLSISDMVQAFGTDSNGRPVNTSFVLPISVLRPQLNVSVVPSEAVVYPGEPVELTWLLSNTGEDDLTGITLGVGDIGEYKIPRIAPGSSMPLKMTYTANGTTEISATARASVPDGVIVLDTAGIFIKTISPEIELAVSPSEIEAGPGQMVNISCLITNTGDCDLSDVTLYEEHEGALDRIDMLKAGDFEVCDFGFIMQSNRTFNFLVTGRDSKGGITKDACNALATLLLHAISLSATVDPPAVNFSEEVEITFTVENTGTIPISHIFIISDVFGPLGIIDYLSPGNKQKVSVNRVITSEIDDSVVAEGFTMDKKSALDHCDLHVGLLEPPIIAPMDESIDYKQIDSRELLSASETSIEEAGLNYSDAKLMTSINETDETSDETGITLEPLPMDGLPGDDATNLTNSTELKITQGPSGLTVYIKEMMNKIRSGKDTEKKLYLAGEEDKIVTDPDSPKLTIEGITGGDQPPQIFNIEAFPSEPLTGMPVRILVHAGDDQEIKSVTLRWAIVSSTHTNKEMVDVDLTMETEMKLDEGTSKDGFWTCVVPGQPAGTYLILSISVTDGKTTFDDGQYILLWKESVSGEEGATSTKEFAGDESSSGKDMLYIESSTVSGKGDVSMKSKFHQSSIRFDEKITGYGSIEMESERNINEGNPHVNFNESRLLTFEDGQLKGFKRLESPTFHGGMGASVVERYNATLLEKSEQGMIRSINYSDNLVDYNTYQNFEGMWGTTTEYSKFGKKIQADQLLNGTFETKKKIRFEDSV